MNLDCFKAYDIRGKVPGSLSPALALEIGYAYVKEFHIKNVVIGHDARLSSPDLYKALSTGLQCAGANVVGIGMCGTEEIYHAAAYMQENSVAFDGGIMVTGSHNPQDENGLKLVRENAIPISADTGLLAIKERILKGQQIPSRQTGTFTERSYRKEYIQKLLSYVDAGTLKPFKIVANPGNGCAGLALKELIPYLPFEFILVDENPDGTFPNGIPNPLLPENRERTAEFVRKHHADFGIAWDGDFDRCFFYDADGRFIEGYYIVGMLASALLKDRPHEKIIHDPRLTWNTIELVNENNGINITSKSGHAFIKECMRKENALYGGEMSAHHYFRDFAYCDSGMLPWLLVAKLLSQTQCGLADFVNQRIKAFPCSGEINSKVENIAAVLEKIEAKYKDQAQRIDKIDGLSMEFGNWRFNVRGSNTEPVLRLNVESRADENLMKEKTDELLKLIRE